MSDHILFIIDGLPGGGAENVTLTLAAGIAARGHRVTLLSLGTRLDYAIPPGVDYQVCADRPRGPLRKLRELPRRARALDAHLATLFADKGFPTLVISSLHKTDRIVVRSRRLAGLNVWHCIHGMLSRSYLGNKTGLARWLKKRKMQQVYHQRQVITVSDAVGEDLRREMGCRPARLQTLYNPFDAHAIRQRASAPHPWQGEDYWVHVGRFHPVKRHDRLIAAFAHSGLRCKLLILGQGDAAIRDAMVTQIAALGLTDRVVLAGFQANPLPIIRDARGLVLSSDSEGLPGVAIEALICQTPVVSTRCPGGVAEILSGHLAAWLTELNAEDLGKTMAEADAHPPQINDDAWAAFEQQHIIDGWLALAR
ncbi:glycosyltransferase [Pantoea sp. 1.19]|uniref:glycosyltransferase n=1 Tax=Pantoea sp. 1.19 TaxID=1925589 RepID=UPI0009490ADF|nr:glycosyltransferase [Pantoea sp. 1.19]